MTGQSSLALVHSRRRQECDDVRASVVRMTQDLVSIPSQGGLDDQARILGYVKSWLEQRGIEAQLLEQPTRTKKKHRSIGVIASIGREHDGPVYCITACSDTAPVGDRSAWTHPPLSAHLDGEGWLHGRGAADSKVGLAIFAHIMAALSGREDTLRGRLIFLVDSDEHTGRFAAVRYLVRALDGKLNGVYIGYPGFDKINIGSRGFYRATLTTYGSGGHSGASKNTVDNAVSKAARLVRMLEQTPLDTDETTFGLGPKLTVTAIRGGRGFSSVPERCNINIDIRLTPTFNKGAARKLLNKIMLEFEQEQKEENRKPKLKSLPSWPAYKLNEDSPVVAALLPAVGREVDLHVSGPSNVGNFLSDYGVEATSGFGVRYRNLHAPDEAIDTTTIPEVYSVYLSAVESLLCADGWPTASIRLVGEAG